MIRTVLAVGAPLWVGLSLGGAAAAALVYGLHLLGVDLSDRQAAIPVAAAIVLFGLHGALASANRLAALLRRGALDPTARR